MAELDLEIMPGVVIPGWELYFTASRSGGAGGQHVNKTSTRVTLHWTAVGTTALDDAAKQRMLRALASRLGKDGVLQIVADTRRSQLRNREEARARLAALVRGALHRRRVRRATRPTKGSQRRRLNEKTQRGQTKKLRSRPTNDD